MKKTIVYQDDEKTCGAACLSMIARYHGLHVSLAKCRELIGIDCNGATMYGMIRGAEKLRLHAKILEGNFSELVDALNNKEVTFPFVARIITPAMFEHYIVVFDIRRNKVTVGDPAIGIKKYPLEVFCDLWKGQILTYVPTEEFRKGNEVKGKMQRYLRLIGTQKKQIAEIVGISFLVSLISLMGASVFETIVNNILYPDTRADGMAQILSTLFRNIDALFIAVILLYVFQGILQILRSYILSRISKKMDFKLNMDVFNHLIHLPLPFFTTRKSGEIMTRFYDTSSIREALSNTVFILIIDSCMTVLFGAYLCSISIPLFLVSLTVMFSYIIVVLFFRPYIRNINQDSMESQAQMTSYLKESIDGIETVKAFGREAHVTDMTEKLLSKMLNIFAKSSVIYSIKDAIIGIIASVGVVVILWSGQNLCTKGIISLGSMITFFIVLNYFINPLRNLIELQPTIQTALVAANRLNDILEFTPENCEEKTIKKVSLKGDINFKNITFRYGYRKPILENFSLQIPKGSKVAIIGESGSGKSTMMKLLMKFYKPESGQITIGEQDIAAYAPQTIRDRIAYVSQDVFFFSDTIRNNLTMGDSSVTEEQIRRVCSMAKADSFIEELPEKYNTVLSENASNLSGGQKQRLALARAFLQNPDILILDEATSNMDTLTEYELRNTVSSFTKETTTFIIAHHLNTIISCDRILVIKDGKIVEDGTYEELISKNGMFRKLWNCNC